MKMLANFHKTSFRYASAFFVVVLLSACVTQQGSGIRPSSNEFNSKWLDIRMGTLIGKRGGEPKLLLQIVNKKPQNVWVKVNFDVPKPNKGCVITKKIILGKSSDFVCSQKTIVPDTPYPIYFETFSDEGLMNLVEKTKTKMQFEKRDVDAFMKWLTPPALPITFENIIYTEDFGISNALFGAFKSTGTLVVKKDNIKYTQGDTVINIPAQNIISVKKRQIQPRNIWVVVDYKVSGENKIIGFQGSSFTGSTDIDELNSTLSYITEGNK